MIDPHRFLDHLDHLGISLYTGVPDSLLKELNSEVMARVPGDQHVVAANEGAAVAIAMGHYLRSGTPAVVFLQNSGIGNTINPLLSLADPEVYGTPMVLIIGWRGQPGVSDEPQHVKQGRVMEALAGALDLPWAVLPHDDEEAATTMAQAVQTATGSNTPYLVLVEKNTFAKAATSTMSALPESDTQALASREEALVATTEAVGHGSVIVSSTGMLSRELFEYRQRSGQSGDLDLLTVGGMGHASSIALGIAMREPEREVWCFDGDGALLMHMGSLAVIGAHAPSSYFHVVFNNRVHDSVGGQPTCIDVVDVAAVARACGYRYASSVDNTDAISTAIQALRDHGGPALLEIKVRPGNRAGIGRPARSPAASKRVLMGGFGGD